MTYPCTVGTLDAKVCIVGEALGEKEAKVGKPFVDASGTFLFGTIQQLSKVVEHPFVRKDCYLTNVFKAKPPRDKTGVPNVNAWFTTRQLGDTSLPPYKGKYLTPEGAMHFRQFQEEIRCVNSKLILGFGAYASWALIGVPSIAHSRGTINYLQVWDEGFGMFVDAQKDRTVCITYHPAFIMKQFKQHKIWYADLIRAMRQIPLENKIRYPERSAMLIESLADLHWILEYAKDEPFVAIDIETPFNEISCIAFGFPTRKCAIVVPLFNDDGTNFWKTKGEFMHVHGWMKGFLEEPSVKKVAHNAAFEMQWLYGKYNIAVEGLDSDTMLHNHSMYSDMSQALSNIVPIYRTVPAWKHVNRK